MLDGEKFRGVRVEMNVFEAEPFDAAETLDSEDLGFETFALGAEIDGLDFDAVQMVDSKDFDGLVLDLVTAVVWSIEGGG